MVTVKFDELLEAFEFVSAAGPMEHNAYVSIDTGRIYWTSSDLGSLDEEVPDDLGTSDRYIAVPHKNDLDLGKRLALRFADEHLTQRHSEVRAYFNRKGAYSRFKRLLDDEGILDKWHAFEAAAMAKALREWCHEVDIGIIEKSEAT